MNTAEIATKIWARSVKTCIASAPYQRPANQFHFSENIKVVEWIVLENVKKSIREETCILIFNTFAGHIDPELHQKLQQNIEVMIISGGKMNNLQTLDVEMFHDCNLRVKHMAEYHKTLRFICDGEDLTTREVIVKLDLFVHKQIFALTFEDMPRYAFQNTLLQIEKATKALYLWKRYVSH